MVRSIDSHFCEDPIACHEGRNRKRASVRKFENVRFEIMAFPFCDWDKLTRLVIPSSNLRVLPGSEQTDVRYHLIMYSERIAIEGRVANVIVRKGERGVHGRSLAIMGFLGSGS